jgi:hypothetical protein
MVRVRVRVRVRVGVCTAYTVFQWHASLVALLSLPLAP